MPSVKDSVIEFVKNLPDNLQWKKLRINYLLTKELIKLNSK